MLTDASEELIRIHLGAGGDATRNCPETVSNQNRRRACRNREECPANRSLRFKQLLKLAVFLDVAADDLGKGLAAATDRIKARRQQGIPHLP